MSTHVKLVDFTQGELPCLLGHSAEELLRGLPEISASPARKSPSSICGEPIPSLQLRAMLSYISPTFSGGDSTWVGIAKAILHGQLPVIGDIDWEQLLDDWCSGSLWRERTGDRDFAVATYLGHEELLGRLSDAPRAIGRVIGLGTIIKLAKEGGYDGLVGPASPDKVLIDELASLTEFAYQKKRKEAAKTLGVAVGALDKEVTRRRAEFEGEADDKPLLPHWTVEPWPEPVDGDALIDALIRCIRRHVVLSPESAAAVALWIIFTWVHEEAATHSPILMVTSPEAECGKSTLLGLIGFLVPRSLASVGISPAALFRSIEKWQPTLIIDEADVAFVQNEELRSVVNSGWTRGTGVVRCDGDDNEPRLFSTFCPKAIGLKGKKLPDTTASRAIVIELKRKFADEKAEDFRHVDDTKLQELRQQLLRWKIDNAEALSDANPDFPLGFINRVAANWHLLLAIADTAGGDWPEKAREAASTIAKVKATLDASRGVQLLSDIRAIFDGQTGSVFSSKLVEQLTADPESPWAEYNRGKPITQKQVANLLRAYGIASETVWVNGKSAKGYKRAGFEDTWTRYLTA